MSLIPKPNSIIEALLFSSPEPLSVSTIKHITQFSKKEINLALTSLEKFYKEQNRSFELVQQATGYQLVTKKDFAQWINKNKHIKKVQLTQSALETLAIIAYHQPISKQSINKIRRVDSIGTIKSLLQKKLIKITGRSESLGKALIYSTSTKFLELLNLNKISDLPKPKEED